MRCNTDDGHRNWNSCSQADKEMDVLAGSSGPNTCRIIRRCQGPSQLNEDVLGDRQLKPIRNDTVKDHRERCSRMRNGCGDEDVGIKDSPDHRVDGDGAACSRSARIWARTSATALLVSASISSWGTSLNASRISARTPASPARC